MKRVAIATTGLLAFTLVQPGCSKVRNNFDLPPASLAGDADTPTDVAKCPLQCSVDLRSVIRSCDGATVETCPPTLACGKGGCIAPCAAAVQAEGSMGCEFVMVPPATTEHAAQNCYAAYVVNSQSVATELRIEYRDQSMDLSGAVFTFASGTGELTPHEGPLQPGEGVAIFLTDPANKGPTERPTFCPEGVKPLTKEWPNPTSVGIGTGSSFRLITNIPVGVSTIYPFGGATSFMPTASLILPVAAWGKEHVLFGAWAPGGADYPGVQIVATEDDTELEVLSGPLRNTLRTYKLSRSQTLQVLMTEDPSGSIVKSSKPTTVFGGHSCLRIPSNKCCCDAAQQQLPAVEQWGRTYVVAGHRPRQGLGFELSPVRIVAAFDDTRLSYDPAPPAGAPRLMNRGEIATFSTDIPFVVSTQDADHPIYVAQYMTGAIDRQGDPEFVNVVPAGQYLNAYTFYADPTYRQTSVVVVRQKQGAEFKDVMLECAGRKIADFHPVGTSGDFEYALVDLARGGKPVILADGSSCGYGLHQLRSDAPFAATLWGWDEWASYAYPGGMGQRTLVTTSVDVH